MGQKIASQFFRSCLKNVVYRAQSPTTCRCILVIAVMCKKNSEAKWFFYKWEFFYKTDKTEEVGSLYEKYNSRKSSSQCDGEFCCCLKMRANRGLDDFFRFKNWACLLAVFSFVKSGGGVWWWRCDDRGVRVCVCVVGVCVQRSSSCDFRTHFATFRLNSG